MNGEKKELHAAAQPVSEIVPVKVLRREVEPVPGGRDVTDPAGRPW
jgi:hypothetical protein